MTIPHRIQPRVKGYRLPAGTISVCRPHQFGNPFLVGLWVKKDDPDTLIKFGLHYSLSKYEAPGYARIEDAAQAVDLYLWYVGTWGQLRRVMAVEKLRGRNLACYCPIMREGEYCPCHADVLLSVANGMTMEQVREANIASIREPATA